MAREEYQRIYIEAVPLEHTKLLVDAMAEYLGLTLERREPFHGEPEYRFVAK